MNPGSKLDRETHGDTITVSIVARDKGTPQKLSNALELTVNILDINDHGPVFSSENVNVTKLHKV